MNYSKGFANAMDVYNKEHSKRITPKQTILYNATKTIGSKVPEKDVMYVSHRYQAKYFYEATPQSINLGCDSAIHDNCPMLGYFLITVDKNLQ